MIETITRGMGRMMIASLSTELIYSFVIIVCSLMIYFGTKEIYELSGYKGLKYFRQSFLFFACAYFFRSFIKFILFYFNTQGILLISPRVLNPLVSRFTLIIFMYFSSISIFYLLYSVNWKKWNHQGSLWIFHLTAIIIALFSVLSKNPYSYLIMNLFLFLFVIIAVYSSYIESKKKNKKSNSFYIVYLLLSLFWILNIIEILVPSFFQTIQLALYLSSLGIFLLVLYKVLKKTGN
jgi:hypothetical protein